MLAAVIGRESELAAVSAFLTGALTEGASLLISGEAGIGKSTILIEAERFAAQRQVQVLKAVGLEFEADLSFGALLQMMAPLAPSFELLKYEQRQVLLAALGLSSGSAGDRLVVAAAAPQLLRQIAQDEQLLLVVDDLQWVDRSSAYVIDYVAQRLSGSRIALLMTSRLPTTVGAPSQTGLTELEIGQLDESSALELLDARYPETVISVRQRIVQAADGNPMALLELPRTLSAAQKKGDASLPAVLPLPRRLQGVYEQRLRDVPERTRELLLLLALCGSENLRAFQATVARDRWQTDSDPAVLNGLVMLDHAGRLVFRHSLVASAVVGNATPSQCRAAHARLADCSPAGSSRKAWHLAEAATHPDDAVADLLDAVARECLRRGDAPTAVATMIRAANLSEDPTASSSRFALAAYWGLHFSRESGTGAAEVLGSAGAVEAGLPASLYGAAATAFMLMNEDGDVDSAADILIGALQAYRGDFSDESVLSALFTLVGICVMAGRGEVWEVAEPLLSRAALQPTAATRLTSLFCGDSMRHFRRERGNLLKAIDNLRIAATEPELHVLGAVAAFADCVDLWWVAAQEAISTPSATLSSEARSDLAFLMSQCHHEFLSGRWPQAVRRASDCSETCRRTGNRWMEQPFNHLLALLAAASGDQELLRRSLDRIAAAGDPDRLRMLRWEMLHARALAAQAQRDYEEAYRCASGVSPPGTFAPYVSMSHFVILELVDAAVRLGHRREAIAHVEAIREVGLADMSARMCLLATATEALVEEGRVASNLFRQAISTPGAERTPFDLARVQLLFGEHLRRVRQVTEARLVLTAAAETFERLGARPWTERANAELRASGVAAVRGSSRGRVKLTAQELEIAQLAASGLSNKEIGQRLFMSPRTVSSHLYKVFPKLSITSRAALRDALATQDVQETNLT